MNAARGETALMIGGQARRLCLTLGALAELETAFGCRTLSELQTRLRTLSAGELSTALAILLRAGGEADAAANLAEAALSPLAAATAIAEAFHAALG